MSTVTENVRSVLERVARAAEAAGRDPAEISLVAASKMNGYEPIQESIRAGIRICGENRVQELTQKAALNAYAGADIHFIGHLQRNKVKQVVGLASLIHSVDSVPLLEEIDRCAEKKGLVQDILLELNIAGEAAKSGFPPEALPEMLAAAAEFPHLRVLGLMTVPPICEIPENNRHFFDALRQLFVDNSGKKYDNVSMNIMSMGMSGDFETAIACGSTMVRIGSAIYGPRNYLASEVPAHGSDGRT